MLQWGMERPNAISALKDKRGGIAGWVNALQDQLRQALIDLDHVDSTILLFDPDAVLDEINGKPMPPRHHAFKGQVTRAILDMLRKSASPMDNTAITARLIEERELIYLRKLLVVGAHAVLYDRARQADQLRCWAQKLMATKPFKLVADAIANKLARIVYAVMTTGTSYRAAKA